MAIPASNIVNISPRLLTPGARELEINGLLFTRNSLLPASVAAMTFASAEAVGDFFGLASEEYDLARVYFAGYENSLTKPSRMTVARRVDEAIPASLYGAPLSLTLDALKAVTDGSMNLTIDGTAVNLTNVDLSASTSFSDAAGKIRDAVTAAGSAGVTVAYSSQTKGFILSTNTTGAAASLTFATDGAAGTGLASILGLTSDAGAVLSQGSDALSVADTMSRVRAVTDNWATFTTIWEPEPDEMVEYAAWAAGMGVAYLYLPWSVDAALLMEGETTSPASVLAAAGAGATALQYGGAAESVFIMGAAASIDWSQEGSAITFAFKRQAGLPVSVDDENDASILLGKRVNFRGNYAARNDSFVFQYEGAMFGDYRYIDSYINALWLNDAIQASVMNGLMRAGRVPYNESGYAKIEAWLMDPILRARRNGVIDTGVALSESQRTELIGEAGRDISDELRANGYVVRISDPGAQVRAGRGSPAVSLWYTYAGAVHKIVVASTAVV